MATATGKTVLGLAAVAYLIDSGSLHPIDEAFLEDQFSDDSPRFGGDRPTDVLIVTTDDLLGTQWGRLFEQHCNTPPDYTRVINRSIQLPWGNIDIRAANSLGTIDPAEYRLAIFDEVHNYSAGDGWGEHLIKFIDSSCPVLALTGSVSEPFRQRIAQADRPFPKVFTYTHAEAFNDGVIPDFTWSLDFVGIDEERSSTLESLQKTADLFTDLVDYQGETRQLKLSRNAVTEATLTKLSSEARAEIENTYKTPTALAAALKRVGDGNTAPTEELDRLASGLSNRQTHWWNLRPTTTVVEEIVADAMAAERPCLTLTRSYAEANYFWKQLRNVEQCDELVALAKNSGAQSHDNKLQIFDEKDTGRKILIGPGDRIGTGVDIKTIEVGVNLARPGTGVNPALVQRLGRLLRQASDKHDVSFHHVLGIPDEEALIPTDGEGFIKDVCEFISQVKEPVTGGVMKLPSITAWDSSRQAVISLEQSGAIALDSDEHLTSFERVYVDAIRDNMNGSRTTPVVETRWYSELFSDDVDYTGAQSITDDRSIAAGSKARDGQDRGADGTNVAPSSGQTDGGSTTPTSVADTAHEPLAVEIDPVLVALVDVDVKTDSEEHSSRETLVQQALEEFLGPMVGGPAASVAPITPERYFQIECDPILTRLLEQQVTASARYEGVSEYVRDTLLDALGLNEMSTTILIPEYYQYEFMVDRLISLEDCNLETPTDAVQAALVQYFEISSQDG